MKQLRLASVADIVTGVTVSFSVTAAALWPDNWLLTNLLVVGALLVSTSQARRRRRWTAVQIVIPFLVLAYVPRLFGTGQCLALARVETVIHGTSAFWLLTTTVHRQLVSRTLLSVLCIWGTVLSIVSVVRSYSWITSAHEVGVLDVTAMKGYASSVLGGPTNEWATICVFLLILELSAIRSKIWPLRIEVLCANIALIPTVAALLLTFSRGAYLVSAIFTISVVLISARYGKGTCIKNAYACGGVLITVILLVAFIDVTTGGAVWRTARLNVTTQQKRSSVSRLQAWSPALGMSSGRVILGSGPGTFAMRNVPVAGLGQDRPFVSRPPSTILTLIVEEGLVGIVVQCGFFLVLLIQQFRVAAVSRGHHVVPGMIMLCGVCALWIKETTFSSLFDARVITLLYFVVLGLIAREQVHRIPLSSQSYQGRLSVAMTLWLVFSLCTVVMLAGPHRRAAELAERLAEYITSGDLRAAVPLSDAALSSCADPYYYSLRGLLRAQLVLPLFTSRSLARPALSASEKRQLEQALSDLERALAANPSDDLLWHNRGWIRFARGDAVGAVLPDLEKAIRIDSGSGVYRIAVGMLYETQGRFDQAINQFCEAISRSPGVLDSMFYHELKIRNRWVWKGSLGCAITRTERDSAERPGDPIAQARLARLYLEDGHYTAARKLLLDCGRQMPQLSRVWVNLARSQVTACSPEAIGAVRRYLERAMFFDPVDPAAWVLQARLLEISGNRQSGGDFRRRARILASANTSRHSSRVTRVYHTRAVVRDDVLPEGLLEYCSPSYDLLSQVAANVCSAH